MADGRRIRDGSAFANSRRRQSVRRDAGAEKCFVRNRRGRGARFARRKWCRQIDLREDFLNGLLKPDAGTIFLAEREYRPTGLGDAQKVGISTAFQELSLIPDLSVAINLAMPDLPRNAFKLVKFGELRRRAEEILERYHISDISPKRTVSSLSLSDKQRLEIIRVISRNPRVLILDEPTAALTDVTWLYDQIAALTARGGAVIFITHRLKEVRDVCKRATVLRNGELAGVVNLAEANDSELFRLMIGRSMAPRSLNGRCVHRLCNQLSLCLPSKISGADSLGQ